MSSELSFVPEVEYPKLDDYNPRGDDGKIDRYKLQTEISDYLRKCFVIYDDNLNCFYQWNHNHDYVYTELSETQLDYVIIDFLDHFHIATKCGLMTDIIRHLKKSLLLWKNNPIQLMKDKTTFEEDGDVVIISPEEQLEPYACYITDPRASKLRNNYPLFAFNNGLFNYTTGELLPFTPYIFVTDRQRIYCNWQPGINHVSGQKLLRGLFKDSHTLNTVLDMLAYSVYRTAFDYVKPYIWILYGVARTGKSRTLDFVKDLLGTKGYTNPIIEDLCGKFGKECLIGKRACLSNECSDNFIETNWLKQVVEGTGENKIFTIERKHKKSVELPINCTFVFATNNIVKMGTDTGMRRRVRVIPYKINQDSLEREWRALTEDDSFYSWLAEILYDRWIEIQKRMGSIEESPEVVKATSEYMREQSNIEAFMHDMLIEEATNNTIVLPSSVNANLPDDDPDIIADMIVNSPTFRDRRQLYLRYTEYCRTWGLILHTPQVFNKEITDKYRLEIRESNGNRIWVRGR